MNESLFTDDPKGEISPRDLELGRDAFLSRLRSQINEGKTAGIRLVASKLLKHYEENPDHLISEVSSQLRINRADLLGVQPSLETENPTLMPESGKSKKRNKIGPVEQRILDLIDAEEDMLGKENLINKIAPTDE